MWSAKSTHTRIAVPFAHVIGPVPSAVTFETITPPLWITVPPV